MPPCTSSTYKCVGWRFIRHRQRAPLSRYVSRLGQNHVCTVYIRYFLQGNHQIYGHIRCIYTVLANPICKHSNDSRKQGQPNPRQTRQTRNKTLPNSAKLALQRWCASTQAVISVFQVSAWVCWEMQRKWCGQKMACSLGSVCWWALSSPT